MPTDARLERQPPWSWRNVSPNDGRLCSSPSRQTSCPSRRTTAGVMEAPWLMRLGRRTTGSPELAPRRERTARGALFGRQMAATKHPIVACSPCLVGDEWKEPVSRPARLRETLFSYSLLPMQRGPARHLARASDAPRRFRSRSRFLTIWFYHSSREGSKRFRAMLSPLARRDYWTLVLYPAGLRHVYENDRTPSSFL
jgi:hypothetical protein